MRRPAALLIRPFVLLSLFIPLVLAQTTTPDERPRCLSNVCLNGGSCFINKEARSFECSCPSQTTGTLCETRIAAESTTTTVTSTSTALTTTTTTAAVTATAVEEEEEERNEVDSCSTVHCLNGGSCRVKNGAPVCLCRPPFSGERCANVSAAETSTIRPTIGRRDPCDGVWCGSGMKCVSRGSLYNCLPVGEVSPTATSVVHVTPPPVLIDDHPSTPLDHDQKHRNACHPNPCQHSAPCSIATQSSSEREYVCSCLPGFTGVECEMNIDDCVGVVCQNAQHVCVDGVQTYECRCPEGYRGTQCDQNINECAENPRLCRNGATCVDSAGNYSCVCQSGFTGRFCEVDIDECAVENTCKFGLCRNTPGSFECFCQPNYTGADCSLELDASPESCNSRPCQNNGVCQRNVVGSACLCLPGFSGKWCEEVVNLTLSASEALTSGGLVGNLTETVSTSASNLTANNPCDINPCQFDGTCVADSAGGHRCICHAGFTGSECEIDEADCLSAPCANGGECFERSRPTTFTAGRVKGQFSFDNAVGFVCVCLPGYQGETCVNRVQPAVVNCASNPCSNGSKCEETNSGYQCVCPVGYVGGNCSEDVDECRISTTCGRNAIKCINLIGSYRCVCAGGFGGSTNCDTPLSGCEAKSCNAHESCTPYMNKDGSHGHTCHCPAGKGGPVCASDTTASFNQTSQLAIVSAAPESSGAPYELSLSLRTTLPNCTSVVSGVDVLGRVVFAIDLREGLPAIQVMGVDERMQPNLKGETLNDGEYWKIAVMSQNATVKMLVWDAAMNKIAEATWPLPGTWRVFTTKFGGGSGDDQHQSAFTGCIRDVIINGKHVIPAEHAATSLNVALGCPRLTQCTNDTCSGNGKCVDLWDHYSCDCKRPFLPPQCAESLVESTFGRENVRSYARIEMSRPEQQEVERTTDISMLVRTLRANGTIAFLGSPASDDSDLDTFLAIELLDGQLRVNVKLGGRDVHSFIGGSRIHDGLVHEIRLLRRENSITGFVDGKTVFTGEIKRPFPHPLLATLFYVGGMPAATRAKRQQERPFPTAGPLLPTATFNNGAFSTDIPFKGTIQDVRINGMHVPFWPAPASVDASRLFGRVAEQEQVLKGTVSDDTCRDKPCEHGTCKVTFNDYACTCEVGWMGRTCSSIDHCAKNVCPLDASCSNIDDGYLCQGAATFEKYSSIVYELHEGNATTQANFSSLSFKLRTRDHHGVLFYAWSNSSDSFLLLDLSNGALNLKYQLGGDSTSETNITGSYNVTDGQWHAITLTLLSERSTVNVDTQQSAIFLSARSSQPLSQLFVDDLSAQLTIGAPSNDLMKLHASRFSGDAVGYKGCLDEVQWGTLPALSLMSPETYGGSLERTVHFKPVSMREVTSGVCQSEPQCALPDPVNGPCLNNATCDDLWNFRKCRCLPGFEGAFCETNIDDCKDNECVNGTCVDGIEKYTCACKHGFGGRFCDKEINECDPQPCQNDGTCHDLLGKFECTCNANFTGDKCEFLITVDCESSPCQNDATCEDKINEETKLKSFTCQCPPGYTGVTCDREIDYCESNPCRNGAVCTSRRESFSHFCACAPGFAGTDCEVDIDECESSPCLNDGVCSDGINGFQCNCTLGYNGETCADDINECKSNPCLNNGTCENLPGSYECKCEKYYLGDHCEEPGSCLSNPCTNHAICEQESATAHKCACSFEYTGVNCENEIDFCLSTPCVNGGSCERKLGGFICHCPAGYSDSTCSEDINECASNPCQHMGRCVDQVAAYECDCASTGYEGENCAVDIDECQNATNCQHGTCENMPGTYKCSCEYGFIGSRCNKENLCLPANADNRTRHQCKHGRCVRPDVRSRGPKGQEYDEFVYDCECDEGFEGIYCTELSELVERAKGPPLTYIIGPVIGVIALLSVLGCLMFMFVARNKRATHGTYSPSRQEMSGARVQMNPMMKPPPEERLI